MHLLSTLSIAIGCVITVGVALFAFLNLRTARTYRPTVDQIVSTLDAVLASRGTYSAWDEFICVPIRHDEDLEKVRLYCIALESETYLDKSRAAGWRGDAGFNATGLARIKEIRDSLVHRHEQAAKPPES